MADTKQEEPRESSPDPKPTPKPATKTRPVSASLLRTTSNVRRHAQSITPSEIPVPPSVQEMAAMSARDRVKYEAEHAKLVPKNRQNGFSNTARFGAKEKNEKQQKAEEEFAKRQSEKMKRLNSPCRERSRERAVHKAKENQPPSYWSRAVGDRHMFQFPWKSIPKAVPQRILDPSPGPGAYFSSTSLCPRGSWN